jgi:hypothetical protein
LRAISLCSATAVTGASADSNGAQRSGSEHRGIGITSQLAFDGMPGTEFDAKRQANAASTLAAASTISPPARAEFFRAELHPLGDAGAGVAMNALRGRRKLWGIP